MALSKHEIREKINRYVFKDRLQIGNFIFDEEQRILLLGDQAFPLRDKLFSIMCFLAYSQGRLIHRDVLIESIWRNNYSVGQKSLTNGICMLRRIFSRDPGESVNIVTVSKTGYRLLFQ